MEKNIVFTMFLICVSLESIRAAKVQLYESSNFKGANHSITMSKDDSECVNLPHTWNRKVSSVNTNGLCLDLYAKDNCQGAKITLYPGTTHTDMSDWIFNKVVESLRVCEEQLNYNHENRHTILIYTEHSQFHLNIIQCRNIPEEVIKRSLTRVFTYGICYQFFSGKNCRNLLERSKSWASEESVKSIASIERCEIPTRRTTTTESTTTLETESPYLARLLQTDEQPKSQFSNSQLFNYINENGIDNSTYEMVSNVELNDTSRSSLQNLFGKTLARKSPFPQPVVLFMYQHPNHNQDKPLSVSGEYISKRIPYPFRQ